MARVNKGKLVREDEFNKIKMLQEAGLPVSTTAKVVGRSYGAIHAMYKEADWAAHEAAKVAHRLKATAKREAKQAPKVAELKAVGTTAIDWDEFDKAFDKPSDTRVPVTSDLTRIANALERLVTAWEAPTNKRKFF